MRSTYSLVRRLAKTRMRALRLVGDTTETFRRVQEEPHRTEGTFGAPDGSEIRLRR